MAAFVIKRTNTAPAIVAELKQNVGTPEEAPINLTEASEVYFLLRPEGETGKPAKLRKKAEILEATKGVVRYQWASGDTATAGKYAAEWEIVWKSLTTESVPNEGYISIEIIDNLEG
jgi:hypothetical protein